MKTSRAPFSCSLAHGIWFALAALAACGGGSTPDPAATPPAAGAPAAPPATPGAEQGAAAPAAGTPPADLAAATTEASQTLQADTTTWSPEALEDLLAPVALYPDPVLMQLLVAVTNPQEVLDAGNWLIANPNLSGKPQEQAAEKAGFTLPVRAVMQFPEVVDQLCLNMPWTEELGQAYVNDQKGVMDAVQRLRAQAEDVGNLKSSPQMKVETTKPTASEPQVITISPPPTQVVYVPQYDPQAVYAPPVAAAPAPATTTTTTTTTDSDDDDDDGHSTGSMVATGLLAFGAGMLVNEVFEDDDDWGDSGYYGGSMWHGPMPYYPPSPYRPAYGSGFYPSNGYQRPNNYARGGNNVVINQNNNYYGRYNNPGNAARTRNSPNSPITAARPNRSDLQQLNTQAARGPARKGPAASEAWKGQSGYAGNDPKVRQSLDRQAAQSKQVQSNRTASRGTPTVAGKPAAPKVQGGYAGARPERAASTDAARSASDRQPRQENTQARPERQQTRPTGAQQDRPATAQQRPATRDVGGTAGDIGAGADRGRSAPSGTASRPAPRADASASQGSGALGQRGQSGHAANQSSQRGKQSMPAGHAAKPQGGGRRR